VKIKHYVATLALLVTLIPLPAVASSEPLSPATPDAELLEKSLETGSVEVIVQVDQIGRKADVLADLEGTEYRQLREYPLPILALEVDPEGLTRLASALGVLAVTENTLSPPGLASTIPIVNADDVQTLGWTGAGRTVVILDTGIDADHPFFAGRITAQLCVSGSSGATLCPNGMTTDTSADIEPGGTLLANCVGGSINNCDHGTHVAGIAAGASAGDPMNAPANGVAPGANILPVQVFSRFTGATCAPAASPCILTSQADQIFALSVIFLLTSGGNPLNIDAVNMSLGAGNNPPPNCDADPRKPVIDLLLGNGVATVISSGNNNVMNAVGAPGCISTAVTVGATDDLDNVTRNRGVMLDLFAPGSGVVSSIYDDTYGSKGGTSMAAPHVTGAFAVMREAYPGLSVGAILGFLQTSGVPITYAIDNMGGTTTTPRLDLLAALQAPNAPPMLGADADPVTFDEGDIATNTGTFSDPEGDPVTLMASIGVVVDTGGGTWSWSWQTSDGPPDSQTVTITGTDDKDESGDVSFELVVDNVAPSVSIGGGQTTVIAEGDTLDVLAHFTDPGWPDTYTAEIDWGTPAGDTSAGSVTVTTPGGPPGPGSDVGTVTGSFQYGDNGVFTVTVSVTDDDGGVDSASFNVTVGNVPPTAVIDESGTIVINGMTVFLASAGDPVDFEADSEDPGSDDLDVEWNWDDGNTDTATYLNDSPLPDPLPSPEVNPRSIIDMQTHTFADACFFLIRFTADDDDGGTAFDEANVIIVGNSDKVRSAGYWKQAFRQNKDFTNDELDCFLAIINFVSTVFSEETPASTKAEALAVLNGKGKAMEDIFDRELLAALLNFANGAVAWDQLIDTDGDTVGDTAFSDVIVNAEVVRTGPHSRAELEVQKDLLEDINLGNA